MNDPPLRYRAAAQTAVDTGCEKLQLPTGIVSHIDGQYYRIVALQTPIRGIQTGMLFHLGETICAEVIKGKEPVIRPEVAPDPNIYKHPAYVRHTLRCYVGAPILHDGMVIGTLNFSSEEPRPAFGPEQIDLLDGLATTLGDHWVPSD